MGYIRIDLTQVPQFFRDMETVCNSLCSNQLQIDKAFNVIQETWRDKNAVMTCAQLEETARGIAQFYDSLGEAIDYVVRVCNNRADYVDCDRFNAPHLDQFTISIMEIKMDDKIINTNPDALEEFKRALDKYVQSIDDNVNQLVSAYNRIGESWDDEQYERFGDALQTFISRMQTQVDALDRISAFIKMKIDILRRGDI